MAQPTYFVDHKRGEVNELKQLLNNPKLIKENDKKREVIKKVIAYMTLGIDVSKLFSEMVMSASTKDLVQKKMVYHYLCNYAQQKSDLAILAINTLQKDCRDEDPMVRGLALRSLCSLKLPNIGEYVMIPLRTSLNDQSAYVRKTAVTGVAKLFQFVPTVVTESDLVHILYNMLKDKDPQVITNVIYALNEILASEGKMAINQQIIMYLLNRIREFNEWGQCTVLDLVSRYVPTGDEEMFDIMNLLEDRLKHSNSAVVLGTTKVFLNFTQNLPKVHEEVHRRLKAPLLTLMTGGSFELAYTVLGHITLLVDRAPTIFADSYKHFFCRYNDPSCVKSLKLNIVTNLATDRTIGDILSELSEYVTDVDPEISRLAIRNIGKVAIHIEQACDEAIEHLLSFLDLSTDYITAETCIVIKDLLRKYPERYEDVIPSLQKCLKTIEETDGKVAVIWMIGEYGETIDDAPYILEPLIDGFEDEPSHAVRMELLTATMKLFFKRPPEVQSMLGRLLQKAVDDVQKVDVRDRALMYYRILKLDVHEAARVVNCPKVIVDVFAEQDDLQLRETLFKEFNSLSVTYRMPATRFVSNQKILKSEEEIEEERKELAEKAAQIDAAEKLDQQQSTAPSIPSPTNAQANTYSAPTSGPTKAPAVDLLGDFLGGTDFSAPSLSPVASTPSVHLQPSPIVDKITYQSTWGRLPPATTVEKYVISPNTNIPRMEALLASQHIATFASGAVNGVSKYYLYAREPSVLYLIEAVCDLSSGKLTATLKADNTTNIAAFAQLFQQAIQPVVQ